MFSIIKFFRSKKKRNADEFVDKYNFKLFHSDIEYGGRTLSIHEAEAYYKSPEFRAVIDLSDANKRLRFMTNYALRVKNIPKAQLLSADCVFSLGMSLDEQRRQVGQDVFDLCAGKLDTLKSSEIIKRAK